MPNLEIDAKVAIGEPTVETIAKPTRVPSRSLTSPETSFTATKAQFFYYDNFYKDGETSCYQLVFTNAEDGFSSGGTLPVGAGQLLCLFLCGPQSEDSDNPQIPAGTYKFSKISGMPFTFSTKYGHYVDAFMIDGAQAAWQLSLEGGEIEVTEKNGQYELKATIKAGEYDEETDEEIHVEVTASYSGPITEPGPYPELANGDYELGELNMGGVYSLQQKCFTFNFYNCALDENNFIVGRGEFVNLNIYYNGLKPLGDLPGTYEFVPYLDFESYANNKYLGGYFYSITSNYVIPVGSYCAMYNDSGNIESCSLTDKGGTVTITADGDPYDGNFTFDMNFVTTNGAHINGTWKGNILDKVSGLEERPAGIENIGNTEEPIVGLDGRISAPDNAEVFTPAGVKTGHDNLQSGIYIVRHNGKSTKVIVK